MKTVSFVLAALGLIMLIIAVTAAATAVFLDDREAELVTPTPAATPIPTPTATPDTAPVAGPGDAQECAQMCEASCGEFVNERERTLCQEECSLLCGMYY